VYERVMNRTYTGYRIVYVTNDTEVVFRVPWGPPTPLQPTYGISLYLYWKGEPDIGFTNATVCLFNGTSGRLIICQDTRYPPGTAQFQLLPRGLYMVNITAVNPYNGSVWIKILWINLTRYYWIPIEVPWTRPGAHPHRLIAFAYDVLTGKGIEDVQVIVTRGSYMWSAKTNTTGYAEMTIGDWGYYKLYAFHRMYQGIERDIIIDEDPEYINIPMSPIYINFTQIPPPPINGTEYPPIRINSTNYYWLSIQTVYQDGYPFSRANVTVVNVSNNKVIAQGFTNGTGFVHFLIPANTTVKIMVSATNPQNASQTFYAEKTVNMTQHYYIVFRLPWISRFYAPEVMLMGVLFAIHRGQGYYFGNVSHLVVLTIWTNKPQNVTVLIGLYNVSGGKWVANRTVNLALDEGVNTFFEWVSVNASTGGRFRIFANITKWEYDTNTTNNWMWSNEVFLKPQVDIQIFVLWRPIEQKQTWSILPEDIIEIDIGIRLPINTSTVPAKLVWRVEKLDLRNMTFVPERGAEEDLRIVRPGMVWRNITVSVPWTSRIVVTANVTHEWEDFGYNNYVNITIDVDPDVKIGLVSKPSVVREGQVFKVVVSITSNVEPGKGIGWVSLVDNTTSTLLKMVEVELAPNKTVELEARAPENPLSFWIIRTPTTTRRMVVRFAGYDTYTENNIQDFTLTVISNQWIIAAIAIVAIIVIIAVIAKLVKGTVTDIVYSRYFRFVKRRSTAPTYTMFISRVSEDEKMRFVKKKD